MDDAEFQKKFDSLVGWLKKSIADERAMEPMEGVRMSGPSVECCYIDGNGSRRNIDKELRIV